MKRYRKPKGRVAYSLLVIFSIMILSLTYLAWYNSSDREISTLKYTEFMKSVEQDKVATVTIADQSVRGKFRDGKAFETTVLQSDRLMGTLDQHQVEVEVKAQDHQGMSNYYVTLLMLFGLIGLMAYLYYRNSQGGLGQGGAGKLFNIGKSRARFFAPGTINVRFTDVAGIPEVKEELKDVVEFLKNPEKFKRLGAKIPRGVLLSGDPGNGKTLLAKAVSGEANCPFLSISGSDFVEVFVGVGASRVRDLFAQARRHSPCIVFIDEIDAVGRQRGVGMGGGNDEREQTLNQLLAEMDGFSTEPGVVIVLAATNRADVLDKALTRPGRFDRTIQVPFPDIKSRVHILEVHSKAIMMSNDVNLETIARGTPGYSGADLENLVNEAALAATKIGKKDVDMHDFEQARDKIALGIERTSMVMSEQDRKETAYHESGHSLLNVLQPETDPLHKVTIIPRGQALGVSWSLPEVDKHSHKMSQLEARIVVALGGLLAEKMIFNDQTTGCGSDLQKASSIARAMVCKYGMSDLGPTTFESQNYGMGAEPEYSPDTARKIDEEVSKIIGRCREKGERLLRENIDKLHKLAEALLDKETLLSDEVYQLLGLEPRQSFKFTPSEKGGSELDKAGSDRLDSELDSISGSDLAKD